MSTINGAPPYIPPQRPWTGNSAGNPDLEAEELRSKQIQAEGLRMSNDATQDSNVKAAAEKRR
jgi:hypothetical protein